MSTVANAAEWLRLNELPYFKVEYKGKLAFKFPVDDESDGKKEPVLQDAITFLQQVMSTYEPGYYTLIGRKQKQPGSGDMRYYYTNGNGAAGQPAQIGGLPQEDRLVNAITEKLTAQFEARLKDLKHEQEIAELKKKVKEAESSGKEFGLEKIGEVLGQVLEVGNMMKKPAGPVISGPVLMREPAPAPQAQPVANTPEPEGGRFSTAIKTITDVTGDSTVEVFEALARIAQDNPEQFHTYLNFLKNA